VLAAAAPWLQDCRSALDVGAGFGALTLPLARRLDRVTALEPAPAMAAALRRAVGARRLDNVEVVEAAWAERPLPAHDVVVCAHVGPLLRRGAAFFADAMRLAARAVVLVRDAPGGDDKFFFPELYPRLLGRPYARPGGVDDTVQAVRALGVVPDVVELVYRSDQPFESLEEACDFWMTYMGLEATAARAYLRRFLGARLRREATGWLAPFRKRAVIIAWRVGGAAAR
jgi:SAM-dependent methyltransferase